MVTKSLVLCVIFTMFLVVGGSQTVAAQHLQQQSDQMPIIKAIVVRGNEHLDTAVIQAAITRTKLEQPANEDDILADLQEVFDLGYFVDAEASFELAVGGLKVVFDVIENPLISGIEITGATIAPVNDYVSQMQVTPGSVLNMTTLMEDLKLFQEWALDEHGISLRPIHLAISEEGVVMIEVAESIVEEILIIGNDKTKDHVIRRELTIQPGDVLDFYEIMANIRKVLMLGHFEEVGYDIADGSSEDAVVLTFDVTERKTGTADFGAGYSSIDGIFGFVEVSEENFFGNGQRINVYLELGKNRRSFKLGFYEPYLDKSGTSFGVNLYNEYSSVQGSYVPKDEEPDGEKEVIKGERQKTGGDISFGRPLGENTRASLILRTESNKYDGDISDYEDPYRNTTLGLQLNTNASDHPFSPTSGYINNISFEKGLGLLGGESIYSKIQASHSRYYEIHDGGWVLALRGAGGRTLSGNLRYNDMFRLGGSESIRGYSYGSEGLVGDKMLLMNAEFRFPIYDFVSGVVFTDWGKAWESGTEMDLTDLIDNYRLNIKLDTAFGLLRLDYGWGLNEEAKREGQFYFGIGQTF